MTGKNYNIALVGAGRMGSRWAEAATRHTRLRLGLVADKDKKAALALAKKFAVPYFSKINKQLLAKYKIDAVFVATPHKYLFQCASAALGAGRHVYLEKPGARTLAEMKKLISLAREKRRKLMLGLNYRFFNVTRQAKSLVKKGEIGKALFIRLRHGISARPDYAREWRMNKDMAGGGVLMDQGAHLIDLVNWFLSSPITEIKSVMSNTFLKTKVEDNAFVILKNKIGQIASISVGVSEWEPIFCLEIFGDNGFLRIDGLGGKYGGGEKLTIGKPGKGDKVLFKTIVCDPDYRAMLARMLDEFVAAMDGKSRDYPSGRDALRVLEVIERIYKKHI